MSAPVRFVAPPLRNGSLDRQLTGVGSPIVLGVLLLIAIEATLMALFVVSYFYLRLGAESWPPPGVAPPELSGPLLAQGVLLLSVVPVWLAVGAIPRDRTWPLTIGLPAGITLAAAYLLLKVREYSGREFLWSSHAYGSLDWTMTGYAGLHVITVLLAGTVVWVLGLRGHFHGGRYTGIQALALYWAFVALGSLFFFATQYLSPHL